MKWFAETTEWPDAKSCQPHLLVGRQQEQDVCLCKAWQGLARKVQQTHSH
jgi:hypothetical protein